MGRLFIHGCVLNDKAGVLLRNLANKNVNYTQNSVTFMRLGMKIMCPQPTNKFEFLSLIRPVMENGIMTVIA